MGNKPLQNLNVPKQGMSKKNPSELENTEYSFAMNANIENSSEDFFSLSNEQSNLLATKFKGGYKVIGRKSDTNSDSTYFFLVNPTTGEGELGMIRSNQENADLQDIDSDCVDCLKYKELASPLEDLTQTPLQTYQTILNDSCNLGFNFNINHPVRKIWIKTEKLGATLYFTDNYNPVRNIELGNLDKYTNSQNTVGGEPSGELICFNADAMLQFKKFSIPEITPLSIELGGQLPEGTYQFLLAYADPSGNEISQYYALTNLVSVFDLNNNIQAPFKEQSEVTSFAIRLQVEGLDKRYTHYKVAVIQNYDNTQSYVIEGLHTVNDNSITYTTPKGKAAITLANLLKTPPAIKKAEGLAVSSNALFLYGLEMEKEWNLQPVVNLMGQFFKWQTSIAKEDLYKDGVASAKYQGFNRDETYPLGVRFSTSTGQKTAAFPFIGREATSKDTKIVASESRDRLSIEANKANCGTSGRTQRWQFYNDATVIGACDSEEGVGVETTIIQENLEKYSTQEGVGSLLGTGNSINLDNPQDFTTLENFIEDNSDPLAGYSFSSKLDLALYTDQNQIPSFEDACSTPQLVNQEIVVGEIVGEKIVKTEEAFPTGYNKINSPRSLRMYTETFSDLGAAMAQNTAFEQEFMPCGLKVYEREYNFINTECNYAEDVQEIEQLNTAPTPYFNYYYGANTEAELKTTKGSIATTGWTDKIHKGALWFKGSAKGREKIIFEISKQAIQKEKDDLSDTEEVRLTIYNNCNSNTPIHSEIVNLSVGTQLMLEISGGTIRVTNNAGIAGAVINFVGDSFYAAIDNKIKSENVEDCAAPGTPVTKYRTVPTNGGYGVIIRNIEYSSIDVIFDSIRFDKKQTYTSTCDFQVPIAQSCKAIPYKTGEFAYTESIETYPDNAELYNSSILKIKDTDFKDSNLRAEFETKFKKAKDTNGNYALKGSTDFRCTPIRHFKMPDNKVAPFMWSTKTADFTSSIIFPLGLTINEDIISDFLDIAANNNLITKEQRDSIVGYEIIRGDRTGNKSVEASGYLYDMRNYEEKGKVKHYSNYPYNDLGPDKLNYNEAGNTPLPHDASGNYNFTFHSPESDFTSLKVPSEMKVEGYIFGKSKGNFSEVDKHPKWVILGDKAKRVATILGATEAAAEVAMNAALAARNYETFIGWVGLGSNLPGIAATSISVPLNILDGVRKAGQYRLNWLKAFRDLGSPKNFAYYYASEGFYNYLQPFQKEGDLVRGINIGKRLKEGSYTTTNEVTGERLEINNLDREQSTFLSLGAGFPLKWDKGYSEFDNGANDAQTSSLTFASESRSTSEGRSEDILKNIASPYVKLKNYIAAQYGTLGSISWVSTGHYGSLVNRISNCKSIFGGDTYITRYYLKRKVPLFVTDAMGLASLTPFDYKKYNNIGVSPRFYCDYELGGTQTGGSFLFPNLDSEYNFDSLDGKRGMYLKPPTKFYLYYYGVPGLLTESGINTNFRTARKELENNFYPQVGDLVNWTQESEVSIRRPNSFFYNPVFSQSPTHLANRLLPATYNKKDFDTIYNKPNGVYYSLPDNTENSLSDPWMVFRANDTFEFPTSYGKLKSLEGIEGDVILGRFENTVAFFNSTDVAVQGIALNEDAFGNGGIFKRSKPRTFSNTDLGYGGTQSSELASCEFGHFHVDAKRGQVMQMTEGKAPVDITNYNSGMRNWFKENLPFKILKSGMSGIDTDNAFNGVGITMGWDSRFNRLFLTKKDYIPLSNCLEYIEGRGFFLNNTSCGEPALTSCPEGYTLDELNNTCVRNYETEPLCPAGYIYNKATKQCVLTEVDTPNCICEADVIASGETICGGATTSIELTSVFPGTGYRWTVAQSGVTGAAAGSGSTIAQVLTPTGFTQGSASYTITPYEIANNCNGVPINVIVTVKPVPNVIATPSSLTISDGGTTNIALTSSAAGANFSWTTVQSGTTGAVAGSGNTIAQTINGTGTVTYTITPELNGCAGASINVVVTAESTSIACGGSLTANGSAGYYEVPAVIGTDTGNVTVTFDSYSVPDRIQLIWNGAVVADSLFIGDAMPNASYSDGIVAVTSLDKFLYNGTGFDLNGTIAVDYSVSDISDSTGAVGTLRNAGSVGAQVGVVANYPSASAKASDGNIKLSFNKNLAEPVGMTIVVVGVNGGTAWVIESLECPTI